MIDRKESWAIFVIHVETDLRRMCGTESKKKWNQGIPRFTYLILKIGISYQSYLWSANWKPWPAIETENRLTKVKHKKWMSNFKSYDDDDGTVMTGP